MPVASSVVDETGRELSLTRAISVFFDREWDPIGMYRGDPEDGPEPGTEYEWYAAHVLGMLRQGETAASISHYLNRQASQSMRVSPGPTKAVAERLHRWWHVEGGTTPLEG